MTKKSKKQKLKNLKPKRKARFWIGKCFNCGLNLEGATTRGFVDGVPVYIDCPRCKAVNNFKKRYEEWKEKSQ